MRHCVLVAVVLWSMAGLAQEAPPPPSAPPPSAPPPTAVVPTAGVAPGAPVVPSTTTPTPAATADEEYGLRMKQLETSVAELKEQIFRSKAKLTLLTEQVQGGSNAGSRLVITHKNQMSEAFLLVEVDYFLDGTPLWQEVDETGRKLTTRKEYALWDGNIVDGPHTLTVELSYRGNGTGAFKYLAGYEWKLKDAITFTAEPGKLVIIDAVAFEQGTFTTEMKDRPRIRFDKNIKVDSAKKASARGNGP